MKISAVIPLYNGEFYIEKAIESLLNQSYEISEIVVVDDFSSDHSVKIVEKLAAKNKLIKLIQLDSNKGVSFARNKGFKIATGDWILFLDADDECDLLLVERYVKKLAIDQAEMIYSEFIQIDEKSSVISSPIKGHDLHSLNGFCDMILRNPIISPSGIMIRRDILLKLNGFDEAMRYDEDVDLWLRLLLQQKKIMYLNKPGAMIRRHSLNTTNTIEVSNKGEQNLLTKYGLPFLKDIFYKQDKDSSEINLGYLNMLIRFEKYQEAEKLVSEVKVSKEHPKYVSFLFTKAIVYLELLKFKLAKQLFEEIVVLEPLHGSAINNLGVLYAKNGDKHTAKQMFEKSIELYPGYLDATFNLENIDVLNCDYRFTKRELRKNLLRYS